MVSAPVKQPVAMAIDTKNHRLFSGCRSGVMVISDYDTGKVIASAPIGNGVDGAGYDPAGGDAFASCADGTLTVIHQDDPDKYHVSQTLQTATGSRNMGVDPMTHKAFVVSAVRPRARSDDWWATAASNDSGLICGNGD